MVASGGDENAPVADAVAQSLVEDVTKAEHEPAVGDKRRERDDDVASLVPGVEAVPEAPGAVPDDAAGSQDSQTTQDDEMHDVMAKIKDAAAADVTFDAAAAAAAVVPPPEPLKAESATPVQDAVVAAAAGVGADPNAVANVKFDSKRMARVSFNSWFDFDSYFEMYMQETFQPFRMRSSCSVEAYRRNQQKVMLNNKSSRGRRAEFPDEAIHHHRIYMCTHAMKARCRGANTRPGQKYGLQHGDSGAVLDCVLTDGSVIAFAYVSGVDVALAPNSSVILEPADSLAFHLQPQTAPQAVLTIRNVADDRQIAFKVKTTRPLRYLVRPNQGLLGPNGSASIMVILQQKDCDELLRLDPAERQLANDKFLVQSIFVDDSFYELVKTKSTKEMADELTNMWARTDKRALSNKKLRCRFVQDSEEPGRPASPPSPVRASSTNVSPAKTAATSDARFQSRRSDEAREEVATPAQLSSALLQDEKPQAPKVAESRETTKETVQEVAALRKKYDEVRCRKECIW
ncbi:unnamed protein product [Phytophthora lilii]|uniref:Unnamed protein product n=1 Tax=Phytophthora lilii TaxID=2077276 RepID=A0A9W6TI85_9STRA|nr:unnamed protein product [Phytophthora lilii]